MRLLILCHRLPYPPHKGEKIRALNILEHLARRHEVHLACLVDDRADLAHIPRLAGQVHELLSQRIRPTLRKAMAVPLMAGTRPLTVGCFYSRSLQRRIDQLLVREKIDGILCSSSPMAEYIFRSSHADRLRSIPRVMDLIDVDSFKWQQYARRSPPWLAWVYRREARQLGTFERRIAREFDRVLVVSEQEMRYFPDSARPANLAAMSNGVDLEFFAPGHTVKRVPPGESLVFTGVMDYRPNIDGICWFVEQVFPDVRRAVPQARLYIVGNRPAAEVRRLARRAGVVVTGFVDDIRDYLAGASVCIVPLRIARGIQNKLLEAMAMGRPVIATREAFEGLDAEPGKDLLVVDDAAAFAAAAVQLLGSPERQAEIGRNARACMEARYSWARNLRLLDDLFPSPDASDTPRRRTRPMTRAS